MKSKAFKTSKNNLDILARAFSVERDVFLCCTGYMWPQKHETSPEARHTILYPNIPATNM